MPADLRFADSIGFDQAIYHVGDSALAQWTVVNMGAGASDDGLTCTVAVTDPNGNDVTPDPVDVAIPVLGPGEKSDLLTSSFTVTLATGPTSLYTIVVTLPSGEATQNTCTVNEQESSNE